MFRLIGTLLVIGAAGSFGVNSVWRMSRRVQALRGLIMALETMKSEICDRMTPLPELIDQLCSETAPPLNRFFFRLRQAMGELGIQRFSHLWSEVVDHAYELELQEGERQVLSDLGKTLGRYDIESQRHVISYTLRRLEGYLEQAEEARRTQGKVHAVLSLAVGAFVVLILL